jgi:hypothetical protein
VLVSDVSLYTSAECPFLDFAAGNILLRDVGLSIAGANTPPPLDQLEHGEEQHVPSTSRQPPSDLGAASDTSLTDAAQSKTLLAPARSDRSAPPPPSIVPQSPYVALRGSVSGKFFGFPLDGVFGGSNAGLGGPLHVLILISATGDGGPIHLYQPSTEQ